MHPRLGTFTWSANVVSIFENAEKTNLKQNNPVHLYKMINITNTNTHQDCVHLNLELFVWDLLLFAVESFDCLLLDEKLCIPPCLSSTSETKHNMRRKLV